MTNSGRDTLNAVLLHLIFRNPDGSLAFGGAWALVTITATWLIWGIVAIARPDLLQRAFTVSFGRRPPAIAVRIAGLPAIAVAVAIAVFVLTASPGRLY